MPLQLISAFGIVAILLVTWSISSNRKLFPWRTVIWGMILQFAFAIFILKTPIGLRLFQGAQVVVDQLNVYANEGAKMVFGPLADGETLRKTFGPAQGFVFAVSVAATIILISALSSLLYHWGVLQKVVAAMAWVMMKTMRTSGSESLAGASNIFLGQNEAALVIKPYLAKMTQSEIAALMTTGFSTIATGVMAVYAGMEGNQCGTHSHRVGPRCACWFIDGKGRVSRNRGERNGRALPFRCRTHDAEQLRRALSRRE